MASYAHSFLKNKTKQKKKKEKREEEEEEEGVSHQKSFKCVLPLDNPFDTITTEQIP